MNYFTFINLNTALNRAIHFIRFRQRLSLSFLRNLVESNPVGKHRCYYMNELNDEQWDELLDKKHTPKVKVQSGFVPDGYQQPNQYRQSDVRQFVRPDTSLMIQSCYDLGFRLSRNRWYKDIYKQAREISLPLHVKICPPTPNEEFEH